MLRQFARTAALLLAVGLAVGCGQDEEQGAASRKESPGGAGGDAKIARTVEVWCHQGQEAENAAMRRMLEAFNKAHAAEGLKAEVTFFPDYQYGEKVSGAAAAGTLPDAMEMDGPLVAQYVASGMLRPLDPYLTDEDRADFLPTIIEQGTILDELYALGAFDSALVVYFDRDKLKKAGVEAPGGAAGAPYASLTWDELMDLCGKVKQAGIQPIALHMNNSADEWFTYAFSPLIWSAGGRLISADGARVEGVLNSETNVETLRRWREIFTKGYASTDPVNPDPFGAGETAMDWSGHWRARDHVETFGDALGVMLLPTFGDQPVASSGSWCWGVTAAADDHEAAWRWVDWMTRPKTGIRPIVEANGAIPARQSAIALFPEFERPPYELFSMQLKKYGQARPRTPIYGTLSRQFAAALRDIARGSDPKRRLDQAAREVQRVLDRQAGRGR